MLPVSLMRVRDAVLYWKSSDRIELWPLSYALKQAEFIHLYRIPKNDSKQNKTRTGGRRQVL